MGFSTGGGGSNSIGSAADVTLSSPADGQVLTYNASTQKWKNAAPVSGGSQALTATAVKTTTYTAAAGDLVPADTTSGAFTISLPTAPPDRSRITIKKIDSSANTVTVVAGGSDVLNKAGGSTSATLSVQNQAISLQYAASSSIWYVVGDDLPLSQLDSRYLTVSAGLTVLVYASGAYPARPSSSVAPAGHVKYIGPSQPTDWLANDEWVNNS